MASWKKIIVSGSSAELANLHVDGLTSGLVTGAAGNLTTTAVNGTGNIVATTGATGVTQTGSYTGSFTGIHSGSFSGSHYGDGSQLTGLTVSAVSSFTNQGDNRIVTSTATADQINGEANLTFDGSVLGVTGRINASTTITGSGLQLTTQPADGAAETTVLVINAAGNVLSDEIDSRVWGTSLVDAAGTPSVNQIPVFNDTNTVSGSTGLTYNGAIFGVTGTVNASSTITGSKLQLTGIAAGTDNSVVVANAAGELVTDEIDARVWGTSLVDAGGTPLAGQVAYFNDADTISGSANFTYSPVTTLLTVGNSTFGTNVTVAGDLTVQGDTFNVNVTNLNVEDQFILLNSGSGATSADGGIIVRTETTGTGSAFGWDDSEGRFGFQIGTPLAANATAMAPDSYVSSVVTSDLAAYQKVGNIRLDGETIYIYS